MDIIGTGLLGECYLHGVMKGEAMRSMTNPCVKILKCVEGQFHKGFILTMNNRIESFVKC